MDCFLITGHPCVLAQTQQADLFEVHVTVETRDATEGDMFLELCTTNRWKAIIIELAPGVPNQPMTCTRITGQPAHAFEHAQIVQATLAAAGLQVSRVKIEAAPWNSHVPQTDQARLKLHPSAYFEYHAKLQIPATDWKPTLEPICTAYGAHLSRNAFRATPDGSMERFTTIRSAECGLQEFQAHTAQFQQALEQAGLNVLKTVTEWCIYDSNQALDAAWYV